MRILLDIGFRPGTLAALLATLSLTGCATNFDPKPIEAVPFKDRSVTQVKNGVRVTTAVPDARETRSLFGLSLYKKRIQPVWIEIENASDAEVVFMPFGLDADYHTPMEVAALNRKRSARQRAEQHFFRLGVDMHIAPGETRSGFVFTSLDLGTKAFNVDLFNDEDTWQFTFFVEIPGLAADHRQVDFDALYEAEQISNFDEPVAFVEALEKLPCCTTDAKGKNLGDPLNIVIIGESENIYYAVIRADWDETEVVSASSGLKTAVSFLTGGGYRYSPVSSLYAFGRRQDIALQKIRRNIHERNHFRLWLAPITYKGRPVWIGQISRDIGVRFTTKTITTHKIDPDVDETREFLLENLAYAEMLSSFAYVGGVGAASIENPRANLTGDPYFTDGLRVVMWIASAPTGLDQITYLDWSDPEL